MESKYTRYLLIGLTVFCIALIGITSFSDGWLAPLRTGVGYFLIPIQSGVNKVGITIYDELTDYASLKSALDENKKLQEEVAQLTEENNRLVSDQFELRRLRELYNLDQEYLQYEKTAARVIAKDSGDWFQVFRVDKGSADGVEVGSNVMAGVGLVGIVTDVGAHYATVRSIIDDSSRVSQEYSDPSLRTVELTADTVENWESYDTVFIGYPIWWGIAAWPVDGFVSANDFTGKTVIPFCTSSSSGLGESGQLLEELAGSGDWQEGQRFRSGADEADVSKWLEDIGMKE